MRLILGLLPVLGILASCQTLEPEKVEAMDSGYYPIQAFFRQEADSLQRNQATVEKTVGEGEKQETKQVQIKDWDTELGAFLSVDLSKPAYAGMYTVDSTAAYILYTASSDEVDIQSLRITFDANRAIQEVEAVRKEDNLLYQNSEKLRYVRQKEYSMDKHQQILLLGDSQYQIVGRFSGQP